MASTSAPAIAAALIGVLAVSLAGGSGTMANATSTAGGLTWPDDDYAVVLEGGSAAAGSTEAGRGAGELRLTGTFTLSVGESPDSSFVAYLYSGSGAGVSAGGVTGEGDLALTITGEARSADGRVVIARDEASAVFSNVSIAGLPGVTLPPIITPLDDTLPLDATWRSCGMVEGTWSGSLAGLGVAVAAYPQATLDQFQRARFLAISTQVGALSPADTVDALRSAADILAAAEADLSAGSITRAEAVTAMSRAVFAAEVAVGEVVHPACPVLAQYSLGVSAPIASLLDAILDAPGELVPADVALLVESTVRAGLTSSDPELAARLGDLLVDAAGSAERGDAAAIVPLILAAVALGDVALADELAGGL